MRMATTLSVPATRRPTNVSLDAAAVADARSFGINVSQACERGLLAEIKRVRETRWLTENKAALDGWNKYVAEHGIPLTEFRQF